MKHTLRNMPPIVHLCHIGSFVSYMTKAAQFPVPLLCLLLFKISVFCFSFLLCLVLCFYILHGNDLFAEYKKHGDIIDSSFPHTVNINSAIIVCKKITHSFNSRPLNGSFRQFPEIFWQIPRKLSYIFTVKPDVI